MLSFNVSASDNLQTGGVTSRTERGSSGRILISDDQHEILAALSLLLKLNRYEIETADSPEAALKSALAGHFDLLLLDMNYSRDTTSGEEGLELLSSLRRRGISAPVVVMTAWGNVELAVEAMRLGANDFVQKPWDNHRLIGTIRQQLKEEESRRQQSSRRRSELDIARRVQEKLLPQLTRTFGNLEYAASCLPAEEVGGDYFDIFDLGAHRVAGLLADVSGKGVAAAMLMANLQACFRSQLEAGRVEAKCLLESVNRLFHAATPGGHYATLFYFEYEDLTRRLSYVNCGHIAPVLLRSNGAIERLESNTTVIGLFKEWECESASVALDGGDVLALFTDGMTEFFLQDGEEFGEDRVINLLKLVRHLHAESGVQQFVKQLRLLRESEEQSDDETILLMKILPRVSR